jgi:hypothetical protein
MSLRQIFKSLTIEGLFYSVISALISGLAGWKISALILTIMDIEISSFPLLSATLAVFAVTEILVTVSITVPLMKIPSSSIADDIRTE